MLVQQVFKAMTALQVRREIKVVQVLKVVQE
jgi:hypothetical protein